MSTIECTFEEFKRTAMDFHNAVSTLPEEELENAWKALGLAYLGMYEEMWQRSAVIVLDMESRAYWNRVYELAVANVQAREV